MRVLPTVMETFFVHNFKIKNINKLILLNAR